MTWAWAWAFVTTLPVAQILLGYSNPFKFPDVDTKFPQIIDEQTKGLSRRLIIIVIRHLLPLLIRFCLTQAIRALEHDLSILGTLELVFQCLHTPMFL